MIKPIKRSACLLCAVLCLPLMLPLYACRAEAGEEVPLYEISAQYDDERHALSAHMRVTVPNSAQEARQSLTFHLPANDYGEEGVYGSALAAMYAQRRYGGMQIEDVQGVQSYSLNDEGNALQLVLSQPLAPHESVCVEIGFRVMLPAIAHRLGDADGIVRLSHFYPVLAEGEVLSSAQGDPLFSRCADHDMTLTFPARYRAVANGSVLTQTQDGVTTARLRAEGVRDIVWLLAADWCTSQETVELAGKQVTLTHVTAAKAQSKQPLEIAVRCLDVFTRLFGAYPYDAFVLCELPLVMEGMEFSGLAMIDDRLSNRERTRVIAHEAAHMWWYAGVGSDQAHAAWQDEAFAEYSVALLMEQCPEYGDCAAFVAECERAYRTFVSVGSQLMGEVNTAMQRPISSFAGAYEYRSVIYDKGVILLDRLRTLLGDKRFFAGLQRYYRTHCGGIAQTEDVIACFGERARELILSFLSGSCII